MNLELSAVRARLAPYRAAKVLVVGSQQTRDIIAEIVRAHADYESEYDKIAGMFLRSTSEQTARALFRFVADNVRYKAEPNSIQTVMSPGAILGRGVGDCKHYASFIVGVLAALQRSGKIAGEVLYRFASYQITNSDPGHVFAVLVLKSGRELYIDPVPEAGGFDSRDKSYYSKTDKNMSLYRVSGFQHEFAEEAGVGKFRLPKFIMKVGAAPSRNSFLLLLKLNVFNLAGKIATQINAGKGAKYKTAWEKAGGNYSQFLKDVQRGANKKGIKLSVVNGLEGPAIAGLLHDGIGAIPAAAAIAAATPLIAIFAKLLRGDGIDVDEAAGAVADGAGQLSGLPFSIGAICGIAGNQARKAAKKAKKAGKKAVRVQKRAVKKEKKKAAKAVRVQKRQTKAAARKAKAAQRQSMDISHTTGADGVETVNIQDSQATGNRFTEVLSAGANALNEVYNAATGGGSSSGNYGSSGPVESFEDAPGAGPKDGGGMSPLLLAGLGVGAFLLLKKN